MTKLDISTGEPIPNTSFRIKDDKGNIIREGKTDDKGIALFEKLPYGKYTYEEFDAPEGYIIDETPYPFEIKENGEIVKAEMKNTGTGTLELTKKDVATGELIPNCGIEILDSNMKVIFQGRTDNNGIVKFGPLPYGKYFYREFNAPEGYIIDETPYPFEISENGKVVKAVMNNKKKTPGYITTDDHPKTGDTTGFIVVMLVLIAGISAVLIIYNVRSLKKKNNKD